MSQVKNLRAMFETNKGDDSPSDDDRGRSLGVSSPSPTPGALNGSPRPLSKVRSNFVVVAKNGQMGLVRQDSSDSRASSRRRQSDEIDNEAVAANLDKTALPSESIENISSALGKLTVDDAAAPLPDVEAAVSDKPSVNPDKKLDEETPVKALSPADPTTAKPKAEKSEKPSVEAKPATSTTKTEVKKAEKPKPSTASVAPKTIVKTAPTKTVPTKAAAPKTAAAKTVVTKPVPKATATKTTTDAAKKTATKPVPKAAESSTAKQSTAKTTAAASKARPTTTSTASTTAKRPPALKPSDHDTGFVKPKVKSPTKPIDLPSYLTAHTASSVSKGAVAPQQPGESSRQSHSRQSLHPPTSTAKSIKRQPSTISRGRPSLGPPPVSKAVQETAKKHKEVDEGFLARMMRPTQASSSRTHDRDPVTPPRKSTSRPSTIGRDHSPLPSIKSPGSTSSIATRKSSQQKTDTSSLTEVLKESNKPASPTQPLVDAKEEVPEVKAEPEVAKEILAETAQVETTKEVAELAHEADRKESLDQPAEEEAEPELLPVPTEEAVAESANVETAEEVAAIAEETDLIQDPVDTEALLPEVKTEEPEEPQVHDPIVEAEAPAEAEAAAPEVPELEHEAAAEEVEPEDSIESEAAEAPAVEEEKEEETLTDPAETVAEPTLQVVDSTEEKEPHSTEDKEPTTENKEPNTEGKVEEADEKTSKSANGHAASGETASEETVAATKEAS